MLSSICGASTLNPTLPAQGCGDEQRLTSVMKYITGGVCDGARWDINTVKANLVHLSETILQTAYDWRDTIIVVQGKLQSFDTIEDVYNLYRELGCCAICLSCVPMLDESLDIGNGNLLIDLPPDLSDLESTPLQNNNCLPLDSSFDFGYNFDSPQPILSDGLVFAPSNPAKDQEPEQTQEYGKKRKMKNPDRVRDTFDYKSQKCQYATNFDEQAVAKILDERLRPRNWSMETKPKRIDLLTQVLLTYGPNKEFGSDVLKRLMGQVGLNIKAWSEKNFCIVGKRRYNTYGCPVLQCINPDTPISKHRYILHPEHFESELAGLQGEVIYSGDKISNINWTKPGN